MPQPQSKRRFITRALIAMAASAGLVFVSAAPASATVHEIVAQWCSGHDELAPPGITGGSKADNLAKPLFASGFITGNLVPFTGDAGPGFLIEFNYDAKNSKTVGTGVFVVLDPEGPIYFELIKPDPTFPAFKACPRLATG
ncbi:hypothetical protein [Microbacterium hominis]|uniref:Uncharacterized protein n=1 Tax=Microbacterium hominis TaxID=162426 RepID=A0A7D4PTX5_9MICO|nr:hypothetical protein [Microbacterium hominis]QKJ19233.1 hypothetical protein HQM25_07535 [Microbacterium hominis]